jgi:hypothetical protein
MTNRPTRAMAVAITACLTLSQPEWRARAQSVRPADDVAAEDPTRHWGELARREWNPNEGPSALPVTPPRTLRASVDAFLAASPVSSVQFAKSSRAAAGVSRSGALKWILIGAVVAAGVVVVAAMAKSDDDEGGTVVMVGPPTIGAPE